MRIPIRLDPAGVVTLLLAGTLNASCLADVDCALESARRQRPTVMIDLSRVRLIDRPTLQYLVDVTFEGVGLTNCPDHVERWIRRLSEEDEVE